MQLLFLLMGLFFPPATPPAIEVTLSSTCPEGGQIHLAVYDSEEGFEQKQDVFSVIKDCRGEAITLEIPLPANGSYVIAAFHDLNGNGILDTSVFGAPAEPYGFATPPPSRWRAPGFTEIATSFSNEQRSASILLKKWKEY